MTMDKLLKIPPRELDAMVCDKVLGLPIVWADYGDGDREPWVGPWLTETEPGHKPRQVCTASVPIFAEEPEEDYKVLKFVRETWPAVRRARLRVHLDRMWTAREESRWNGTHDDFYPMGGVMYVAGDYGIGALLVVLNAACGAAHQMQDLRDQFLGDRTR